MKTILKIVATIALVWWGIPFILGFLGTFTIGIMSVKTIDSQQEKTRLVYEDSTRNDYYEADSIKVSVSLYDTLDRHIKDKDSSTILIKK